MNHEWHQGEFTVSTDPARLDVNLLHRFLTATWWAADLPRPAFERALRNSLNFGLYQDSAQLGLARVITDRATFAHLCDVFVLPEWRRRGLGKWLVTCVMHHPALQELCRFSLVTRDAHPLYAPFGFQPLAQPDLWMEKHDPAVYKRPVAPRQS